MLLIVTWARIRVSGQGVILVCSVASCCGNLKEHLPREIPGTSYFLAVLESIRAGLKKADVGILLPKFRIS